MNNLPNGDSVSPYDFSLWCHCNSPSLANILIMHTWALPTAALHKHVLKRIACIILVALLPPVTTAIGKNISLRLQPSMVPWKREDFVTRDGDQCGQEKSGWVNIENDRSAINACLWVIVGVGGSCLCECVFNRSHFGVFINKEEH